MLTKSDQLLGKFDNLINGPRIYESRKVRLVGAGETTNDVVLKDAKGCPYRLIKIVDAESNTQIFPRVAEKPNPYDNTWTI
jgi:hypothetical protein